MPCANFNFQCLRLTNAINQTRMLIKSPTTTCFDAHSSQDERQRLCFAGLQQRH